MNAQNFCSNNVVFERMVKQGLIWKDQKGYYAFEKEINFFGEEVKGEKYYLVDSYQAFLSMKNEWRHLHETLQEKMSHTIPSPWRIEYFKGLLLALCVADYKLAKLEELHVELKQGHFKSPRQMEEWVSDCSNLESFTDSIHELVYDSPLKVLKNTLQRIDTMLAMDSLGIHQWLGAAEPTDVKDVKEAQ
ncbi:hypothetical protein ACFYKX_11680 [Cytobacillus sp. FJAT-54145]|uniref:Uncharacterized protein n=1 Tax=Cytobacillus spartinae TaxID=3299023 RepID=A0ABW6KCE7_9BACI